MVTRATAQNRVIEALAVFTKCRTVDAVYKKLQEFGIKGVPGEADVCPVACYLNQAIKVDVEVYPGLITLSDGTLLGGPGENVRNFILAFDKDPKTFPEVLAHD